MLRMDVSGISRTPGALEDDLKLVNRLNESRSPYVSLRPPTTIATVRLTPIAGSRTHEQPSRMADVGS